MVIKKKEEKRRMEVKRNELALLLAQEEDYDHLTVYKQKKDFIVYEANDMYHTKLPIYIVVEYYDNIPYLALKRVVDEM